MAVENNVRAVERALAILDCFNSSKSSFTLTELARAIDLSPSTTLRLISTLESKNYIYRNPENMRYYLGYRLAQLSDIAFSPWIYALSRGRIWRGYIRNLTRASVFFF